jgi:hypothetical protein
MTPPDFSRGVPKAADRAIVFCLSCQRSRHGNCDHHMNDGAFDAEDFIDIFCKCPCEGDVPVGGRLIDLVMSLRLQLRAFVPDREGVEDDEGAESKGVVIPRSLVEQTERFLTKGIDDEGNFDLQQHHHLQQAYGEWRAGEYDDE